MANNLYVPQGVKIAQGFRNDPDYNPNDQLSEGLWQSFGVISVEDKAWTLIYRGMEHRYIRPDDGTNRSYIDLVILRQSPRLSRAWYAKPYVKGEGQRPDCYSTFGDAPNSDSPSPQSESCHTCDHNKFKVGQRGRECAGRKSLAVFLLPTDTKKFFGDENPLLEPVLLRVPPTSQTDLTNYDSQLKAHNLPYYGIVTRISFNQNVPHQQMQFRYQQTLEEYQVSTILGLRKSELIPRMFGEDRQQDNVVPLIQPRLAKVEPPVDTGIPRAIPAPIGEGPPPDNLDRNVERLAAIPLPEASTKIIDSEANLDVIIDSDANLDALIAGISAKVRS